ARGPRFRSPSDLLPTRAILAKNQNTYEKMRREAEKKRKAEEKRQGKRTRNAPDAVAPPVSGMRRPLVGRPAPLVPPATPLPTAPPKPAPPTRPSRPAGLSR